MEKPATTAANYEPIKSRTKMLRLIIFLFADNFSLANSSLLRTCIVIITIFILDCERKQLAQQNVHVQSTLCS